jgi:hypothetical protein
MSDEKRAPLPNEIPDCGCDVLLSGKSKSKTLHVTAASRCHDWLRYELTESGHQTLVVSGPTDLAKGLGFDRCEVKNGSEPPAKPKAEPGKPLSVAMKAGA